MGLDEFDAVARLVIGADERQPGSAPLSGLDIDQLSDEQAAEIARVLAERSREAGQARRAAQQGTVPNQTVSSRDVDGSTPEGVQARAEAAQAARRRTVASHREMGR